MADEAMNGGNFSHDNTAAPTTHRVLPLFSLTGRTAIVSGAGAGIGLSVAEALAEAGANVAIWYNSNKKAIEEAEKIEKDYGVKCRAYQVDVTSYEAIAAITEEVVREFNGRLDVFVANSGIPWTQGAALDGELDHYHKIMKTDIDSAFYCARVAGLHWRRQKKEQTTIDGKPLVPAFREGSYVATASISGTIVNIPQLQAAYNAAKAAVIHLCKSLAVEWVGFARANTVSPGYIATEILSFAPSPLHKIWQDKTPMGREGQAHELKGAFLYLASDAASYTTGADIVIDGGYSLP
ncbi:L-xylulose reductase [Lachnellula willkommii]|uniref:L-xylulose reductase n=1 Tax=Lachnellula willkommii TaxID=215461 RepID=A0A559MB63_9HELO|nr:L-xylulose reductase [Lachnellula willkommii]